MTDTGDAARFWEAASGGWQRRARQIDEHLSAYGDRGISALNLTVGDSVLDVGCGPGYCTRRLATRVGPRGHVVGVDLAPAMIDAARRRARQLPNTSFLVADALTDSVGKFDAIYARFSVFGFDDAADGLANARRSLNPGGRIACLQWAPRQHNPWMFAPRLGAARALKIEPPLLASELNLDQALDRLAARFEAAGFSRVSAEAIHGARRISAGTASDDISALLEEGGRLSQLWPRLDQSTRDHCVKSVIDELDPYAVPGGWSLPGCALLITAST